jgi:chromosome transmission fidelity protein 1
VLQKRELIDARILAVRSQSIIPLNPLSRNEKLHESKREKLRDSGFISDGDEDTCIVNYDSDGNQKSAAAKEFFQNVEGLENNELRAAPRRNVFDVQLVYASRTHSQITQFIHEFRRTIFGNKYKCIALASRKNLCINEKIRAKAKDSPSRLNDLCIDLIGESGKGCPYLPKSDKGLDLFQDHAFNEPLDIEDLGSLGKRLAICPYYGSRHASRDADLIAVSYPSLVNRNTQESLGIRTIGNIIMIDEAHNLIDVINSSNGASVSGSDVKRGSNLLILYLQKYQSRLSSRNIMYIKQILNLLKKIHSFLLQNNIQKAFLLNEFLFALEIDNINLYKLHEYMRESKLSQKLIGFAQVQRTSTDSKVAELLESSRIASPLTSFQELFTKLVFPEEDGRIILDHCSM